MTDIGYTHGYYRELSPSLQRFALLCAGFAPPEEGAYLELGFGQGLSACIHAAATGCEIWGTDFNPSQALNALDLLRSSSLDVHLFDQSFAELLERDDLPKFSHIAAHGIWTWISDANRASIVEILNRHLAVGGAAYFSYNTLPGWGSALPLRRLMCLHAELSGSVAMGTARQVEAALTFTRQLVETGAQYFKAHPETVGRLEKLTEQDRNYVAHEYFNRNWQPMHFVDLANWLMPAKLDFAASANLLDQVDELNLSAEAQEILKNAGHVLMRETLRDFYVNQFFRRDLFLRGHRKLSALEHFELLSGTRFALLTPGDDIPFNLVGPLGEIGLQEGIYRPLIEAIGSDGYRPKRLSELEELLPQMPLSQLLQATKVLVGFGHVHPGQEEDAVEAARPRTVRLNREICRQACFHGDAQYLASPVIGAGVMVTRIEQLFLQARIESNGSPADWARIAWAILTQQGFRLQKEGRPLVTTEENQAELERIADGFVNKRLPILMALGVA